jgi:hypothetical protein
MPRIIGVSGSLRRGSFNSILLRAAVEAAPVGTTIEIGTIWRRMLSQEEVWNQLRPGRRLVLREIGDAFAPEEILINAEVAGKFSTGLDENRVCGIGHDLRLATSPNGLFASK